MAFDRGKPSLAPPPPKRRARGNVTARGSGSAGVVRPRPAPPPPPPPRRSEGGPAPSTRSAPQPARSRRPAAQVFTPQPDPLPALLTDVRGAAKAKGRQGHRALQKAEQNVVLPRDTDQHISAALRHFGIDSFKKVAALPAPARATAQAFLTRNPVPGGTPRQAHIKRAKQHKFFILPKGYRYDAAGNVVDKSSGQPIGDDATRLLAQGNTYQLNPKTVAPKDLERFGQALAKSTNPKAKTAGAAWLAGSGKIAGPKLAGNPAQAFVSGVGQLGVEGSKAVEAQKYLKSNILGRGVADFIEIPMNTIPMFADVAKGTASAVTTGNTSELEAIGKGLVQPFTHPVKSFKAHPGMTLLAYSGALGGVEGLAGRGALGETAGRLASRDRADLQILGPTDERFIHPETGESIRVKGNPIRVQRRYGRPAITKPVQKAIERIQRSKGRDPNIASEAQTSAALYGGSPILHKIFKGQKDNRALLGVLRSGAVDHFAGDWEAIRRVTTSKHLRAARRDLQEVEKTYGKGSQDVVPLIYQHIVSRPDTIAADLGKELERLREQVTHGGASQRDGTTAALDGKDLDANLAQQHTIRTLLENDKLMADPSVAFKAADRIAHFSEEHSRILSELGANPGEDRAALMPGVQAHFGAVTATEAARRFRAARMLHASFKEQVAELEAQGAGGVGTPGGVAHPLDAALTRARAHLHAANEEALRWGPYHPDAVKTHLARSLDVKRARQAFKEAEAAHARASHARSRTVGAQQVRRGTRGVREKGFGKGSASSTKAERTKLAGHDETVAQLKAARRAAHGNWRAAIAERDAALRSRNRRVVTGLRQENGQPYTTEQMRADLAKRSGGRPVGFLSHNLPEEWSSNVHSRTTSRPGLPHRRTGDAFRKGALRNDAESLLQQVYDTSNRVVGHRRVNAYFDRFGVGRFDDGEQASVAAQHVSKATGHTMIPVKIGPDQTIQTLAQAEAEGPRANPQQLSEFLGDPNGPFRETNKEPPSWSMLPAQVVARAHQHDQLAGRLATVGQSLTNKWRNASLYTSPRWIFGTPQENAIRLAFKGINPAAMWGKGRAYKAGLIVRDNLIKIRDDKSLPQIARDTADLHLANYDAGLHYGSTMVNSLRDNGELTWAERNKVTRGTVKAWRKWTDDFLRPKMSGLEHNAKVALLGKEGLQEVSQFSDRILGINDQVGGLLADYAHRIVDPNKAAAVGQQIMEAAGNWTHLTPQVRAAVQGLTPFGLWWINSLRFIYRTLPRDHPMATAILAAASVADAEHHPERDLIRAGKPYLGGTFHLFGVNLDPTYYSPAGIDVDPLKTAADMVLPQAMSPLLEARGINPLTGARQQITAPGKPPRLPTEVETAMQIANNVAEGIVPGLRQLRQLYEHGRTPQPNATLPTDILSDLGVGTPTTKPGSSRGLLETLIKIASPIKYIRDPKQGSRDPSKLERFTPPRSSGGARTKPGALTTSQQRLLNQRLRSLPLSAAQQRMLRGGGPTRSTGGLSAAQQRLLGNP